MPRKRIQRKLLDPPLFEGYRPYGVSHRQKEFVELLFDEYEAIKLADYQYLSHEEAGRLMEVSRATFARIYESARRKLAKAMVETREIKTVRGNASFEKEWYRCHDCHSRFTSEEFLQQPNCPKCASEATKPLS